MTFGASSAPGGEQPTDLIPFLRSHGLIGAQEAPRFVALTGGVASDIWLVEGGVHPFVVKRALARLRVQADWHAPTGRNASEVGWLKRASAIAPRAVPAVLAHDAALGAFAMVYMPPRTHPVWKSELRDGRVDPAFAAQVGQILGCIHAGTGTPDVRRAFANDATFHALRLEPYFEWTASRHPAVSDELMALSRATLDHKQALVHGDVSPKNILVGPEGPVFLDAECAWYGDPAFDLAFCLTHLLLKCVWVPSHAHDMLACFEALSGAYRAEVSWEAPDELERRACVLISALLLARVDGKSPVEYLTSEQDRQTVRDAAIGLIGNPVGRLDVLRRTWVEELSR